VESSLGKGNRTEVALVFKMAFQVVELTVDADHNVIDRKVIPYRYLARKDAVDAIESVMPSFSASGYQSEGDFWWAVTEDGSTRVRFIIESV
jgi:hypothetical protein